MWVSSRRSPLRGSAKAEDQRYTVSGPWWYFEKLVFEQEWNIDPGGGASLIPTLRPVTLVGQNREGTRLDLGQMAGIVEDYVLSVAGDLAPFQKAR